MTWDGIAKWMVIGVTYYYVIIYECFGMLSNREKYREKTSCVKKKMLQIGTKFYHLNTQKCNLCFNRFIPVFTLMNKQLHLCMEFSNLL